MKVLIIGGTGTMGAPLVKEVARSYENHVVVISRHKKGVVENVEFVAGDAFDLSFMQRFIDGGYDAIVDLLWHSEASLSRLLPLFLRSTKQYVFFSSAAVYADSEKVMSESSPRFYDVESPEVAESSREYHFVKARLENMIRRSATKNWTIVRPHVTYNDVRLPLCTWEMDLWLSRAVRGLEVAVPQDVLSHKTTFTCGDFVARQVRMLIGNDKSLGEVVQLGSDAVYTWEEILRAYQNVLQAKGFALGVRSCSSSEVSKQFSYMESRFKNDRMLDRVFNIEKYRRITGDFPAPDDIQSSLAKCLQGALLLLPDGKIGKELAILYARHDRIVGGWTPSRIFTMKGICWYYFLRMGLPYPIVDSIFRFMSKIKFLVRFALNHLSIPSSIAELRYVRRIFACRRRYRKVLKGIREKSHFEKIKVLFVVCEIAKFKCRKLFEEMQSSDVFDPLIALSAWNEQSELSDDELELEFLRAESFFDKLGFPHVRTVATHPRVCSDFSEFTPDIVFYSEPWRPCGFQSSEFVSRFALTCFVPYYVPNYGNFEIESQQPLHKFLYLYFTLPFWAKFFGAKSRWWDHASKFVPIGHPALDFFTRQRDRKPTKNYIVFAPHHSIPHPKSNMPWFLSTFDWTGRPILEYAKQHPEQRWVFKPHPILRKEVVTAGMMTKDEVDAYYAEWEKIGIVCYDSDYQELFLESKAIITDSGSFMTEAGATGRPVIRLVCSDNRLTPLPPSKIMYDTYYQVKTLPEMYSVFKTVLEDGLDPNKEARLSALRASGVLNTDASKGIVEYLRQLIGR